MSHIHSVFGRAAARIVITCLFLAGSLVSESFAIEGPGWRLAGAGLKMTVDGDQLRPSALATATTAQGGVATAAWTGPIDADFATDEIKELARGLLYDPLRIFNYVRNSIAYEHYYGCKKGAALTLLERSGNDFDQSALLVALLREAAASNPAVGAVSYKYGMMTIPVNAANQRDLTRWLGLSDPNQIATSTVNGGWPYFTGPDKASFFFTQAVLPRVCVEAVVGGTARLLDPSFKQHTEQAGIDIKAASGYNRTTFLAQAGGAGDATQVSGMNVANVNAHLTGLATNLANYLKTAPASGNATMDQVIGGRAITGVESADYSSTAYFAWTQLLETWTEIPGARVSVLEVRAPSGFTWSLPTAELRGRRLALAFAAGTPRRAQLWLDDTLLLTETGAAAGSDIQLTTTVTHPHVDFPHDQSDEGGQLRYQRTGTYAIIYAFDPGADHVRQREAKLAEYKAAGLADNTREVRSEILNLMGLRWLRQTELGSRVIDRASNVIRMNYHRVGRTGQEAGYYVDVAVQFVYLHQRQNDDAIQQRVFELSSYVASAFEHGIVEEVQEAEAVSTVDLVSRALQAGEIVFRADSGNWGTVRPQLVGYSSSQLFSLDDEIGFGATILLPRNGSRTVNQWRGTGYASVTSNYVAMIISGGYFGGFGTIQGLVDALGLIGDIFGWDYSDFLTPGNLLPNFGADPVDLATGAYVYEHTDLTLGSSEPRGLVFSRQYHSRLRQRDETRLGPGWTHNYHLRLTKNNAAEAAFGSESPAHAVAALVAIHAALDVYDVADPKRWSCAMLACGWAVDQVNENAVTIQMGDRNFQFLRQPDGTYLPPLGLPMSLVPVGGGYEMTFRHGNTVVFDGQGRGTKIRDPYGKEMTLAYNLDNTLATVTDCFSRTLTLGYIGGQLTSVADGTGRSVSFGHDAASDLTACIDPEGKTWQFHYVSGHRLEKTIDPDNRAIVQNLYDVLDRVKEQRSQGDAARTWKFYYGDAATVEENPSGGRRTLSYDSEHRVIADTDANGRVSRFSYDGRNHRLSATTPLGETTNSTYGADHNPRVITDPLNQTRQMFYDAQQRLDYVIDRRGKTTDFSFNATHQLASVVSPEGVTQQTDYYTTGPHAGLVQQRRMVSAAGTFTTSFEYDTYGQVNKVTYPDTTFETFVNNARGDVTSHTDRRGFTTTFQYNQRRQLTFTYLPTVNGVNYVAENRYDNSGNLWKQFDRFGNLTQHTYTATQKPLVTTHADGETLTREYDERDWLRALIDHHGKHTVQEYFADGTLSRMLDPLDRQRVSYTYDGDGRLYQTRSPMPSVTGGQAMNANTYTARGELWKTQDPLGRFTEFTYDAEGNLQSRKNRRSHTWQFTYDDEGRLEDTVSPLTMRNERRYDGRGLLQTMREPSGQLTTYTRDSLGRLDLLTDPLGTIDYGYDAEGRLDTVQENTPGAPLIDRDYDALGRLVKYRHGNDYTLEWIFHDPQNAFSLKYPDGKLVRYELDSRSRLWKVTDWNGRVTTYLYDDLGRLEWTNRPNGTKRHVSYDVAGQIMRIDEIGADGRLLTLFSFPAYWDDGQLRQQCVVPASTTQASISQPVITYDADDRVLSWNGQPVMHDLDGNLTSGPLPPIAAGQGSPGLGSYSFDTRNRLTACAGLGYVYDAENLRTAVNGPGGMTQWVINPAGAPTQPLLRTKPDGTVTRYVWGIGLLYEEDNATQQTRTYHYDRRGSTVALTSGNGTTVTDRWQYGPYGERLDHAGFSDTPFQFSGFFGVQTDSNGLLQMGARYYNVELRRFISADPMGFGGGTNFYMFVDGDPMSRSDSTGLWFGIDDLIASGVGAVIGLAAQGIGDLVSGHLSSWQDYTAAAVGGAAAGEATLYVGPVAGAAIGGATTNLARQGLNYATGVQDSFSVTSFVFETGGSALAGKLGSVATESLARSLSNASKGALGEWASYLYNRAQGATLVGEQVERAFGTRTTADFIFEKSGFLYIVEAKFGSSTLTPAQRAAQRALGDDLYQVERWGYDWVQRVGGNLGFGLGETGRSIFK